MAVSEPTKAASLLRSLNRVGPAKPVGYLPLNTVKDLVNVEVVMANAAARGLAAAQFGPENCCIRSGALYVYDRQALRRLLRNHADLLAAANMPLDPDHFIARIAAVWLEPSHPVHSIIAQAFGDAI